MNSITCKSFALSIAVCVLFFANSFGMHRDIAHQPWHKRRDFIISCGRNLAREYHIERELLLENGAPIQQINARRRMHMQMFKAIRQTLGRDALLCQEIEHAFAQELGPELTEQNDEEAQADEALPPFALFLFDHDQNQ